MNDVVQILARAFPETSEGAVKAIDRILECAVRLNASDIHCDPHEYELVIRFRIDGDMEYAGHLPKSIHEEFISRLKILSECRTDVHSIPQDGRFRMLLVDGEYNMRTSFMPTYHGENAVIRLLPARGQEEISFARLGFCPDHVVSIARALQQTSGLVLIAGPTGSGKTTTLYTCLSLKSQESLSVLTLEDPVEYEMPGIRQIHIRHQYGVNFAGGLRSALRQDPDVIMVGEIRDAETAQIAIHTALTGHLVLSTIHTNSALEVIPRLIDMGIDRHLLAATLRLVISQRLIRLLCTECKGLGCAICRKSGYRGRTVIAETCEIDKGFRDLMLRATMPGVYEKYAESRRFRSMLKHGHDKAEWGLTSHEEVISTLSV